MVITASGILCNIPRLKFYYKTVKTFGSLKMQVLRRRSGTRRIRGDDLFCGDRGLFSVIVESEVCYCNADLFSNT